MGDQDYDNAAKEESKCQADYKMTALTHLTSMLSKYARYWLGKSSTNHLFFQLFTIPVRQHTQTKNIEVSVLLQAPQARNKSIASSTINDTLMSVGGWA